MQQPRFITFEGIEGVGKSTNIHYFAEKLTNQNIRFIHTREPGGTPFAEKVRQILLAEHAEKITPKTECLLLYAARIQHIEHVIKPALQSGVWVLCDRFFDATFAYQGGGRKISLENIKQLHRWALDDFAPHFTILLDAPAEISLKRIANRGKLDRFEKEDLTFFENIRACYLNLAKDEPARFRIVNASLPLSKVQEALDGIIHEMVSHA